MKIKNINNILIKGTIIFISFFIKNSSFADALADNLEALQTPTLSKLNQEDSETYPKPSAYTLTQGDSSSFVVTKYLSSIDDNSLTSYTPISFNLNIDDITIDDKGTNYSYYKWVDSAGNKTLSLSNADEADFFVQYNYATISSYLSSLDSVGSGDFYYVYDSDKSNFSTSNTNAVYAINYDDSYATISVNAEGLLSITLADISDLGDSHSYVDNDKGAAIESINGNFYQAKTNSAYGGAIYSYYSSIGEITGDFVGNYVMPVSSSKAYGGAIYNYYTNEIGDISGNFVGNYAYSQTGEAKGGAIYNYYKVAIGDIQGDFIGNYAQGYTETLGGAIHNENGTIESITGDFIGNYASSQTDDAFGGAIYTLTDANNYTGTIGAISGDFIGNYVESLGGESSGAVIYNYKTGISSITGDFIGNYALGYSSVIGGTIYNYYYLKVGAIEGDFIGNYAIASAGCIKGGVIYGYNNVEIASITGDFIGNYAQASTFIEGGIICSYKADIDALYSNFIGNYSISENTYIKGGVIYNYVYSEIGAISGDFIANYAQAYTYILGGVIYNYNASIGDIEGDFFANYGESTTSYVYGGVIYNYTYGEIDSISGNFISNYAQAYGDAYGGVIYNKSNATIGNITGNFIGNYASSESESAYGGGIHNEIIIGNITGDFIGNYVYAYTTSYGGAISNYATYAVMGDITGSFIANYSISESSTAYGGAIYNKSFADIGNIIGSFIGNYAQGYGNAFGGAICNYSYSEILSITGDFIGNYASSNKNTLGGVIYNTGTIGDITGDFIANYAYGTSETSSSSGGAIYTYNNMGNITGDFIGNYASGNYASGGAIFNAGKVLDITGDFASNYVIASNSEARGGAINNAYYSSIESITGNFFNNYATSETSNAYGGAIYNGENCAISYLSGDFIGNYASSTSGEAYGGAIYNFYVEYGYFSSTTTSDSYVIDIVNANFINNYASGESAYGGAIYNNGFLRYSLEEDTYAVAMGNTATSEGGFLYNTGIVYFDIASGGLFTIGVYENDDSTDSIYNNGSFEKSGAGTMLIRSNFLNEAYSSDTSSGGSLSVSEGVLIIEGTDESEDLDSVWFNSEAVLNAISGAKASFVLGSSMNLGEYLVVGTYEGDALVNQAYFASDSVFAVHVETTGSSGDYSASDLSSALVGDGNSTISIETGAVLVIYGASAGTDIRILEDFDGENSAYAKWDVEYISSANPLYEITVVEWREEEAAAATISDSGDSELSVVALDDEPAVARFSLMSTLSTDESDSDFGIATIDDESDSDFGIATIDDTSTSQDAGTSLYLSTDVDEDVVAEVGQIAEIGGVVSNMGLLVNLARDTTMARFSVFDKMFYAENETNFGIWATPMYNYTEARGLNAGTKSTGYDMYFGGANLGVDYTLGESYRVGLAFHGGYGETNSVGDFSLTNNDFGFYSLTLYNGFKEGNFMIYADVNLAMTHNDLNQYNSSGTGNFYADVDAYAISGEIRIEYLIEIDSYNIIPHLGLNYMYLSINNYDVYLSGESVLNVESKGQSVLNIPVGISFSTSFDLGNEYFFSPILDLGVIFSFGDLYSKSSASFVDIDATELSVQAYNDYTFSGLLGFEFKKNNSRAGLSYFIEASENIVSHNFRLNYRYSF